jgi:hypothetical protein
MFLHQLLAYYSEIEGFHSALKAFHATLVTEHHEEEKESEDDYHAKHDDKPVGALKSEVVGVSLTLMALRNAFEVFALMLFEVLPHIIYSGIGIDACVFVMIQMLLCIKPPYI